uniref:Uncharacterized protein n=1 Tax=Parascaris univalens TaxID=6257 RepID=A0A915AHW0_PARUN
MLSSIVGVAFNPLQNTRLVASSRVAFMKIHWRFLKTLSFNMETSFQKLNLECFRNEPRNFQRILFDKEDDY